MRLAVIGLGHAGLVCAAGLAQLGHEVAGVDRDARKVELLNRGGVPLHEPGLPALVALHRAGGRLSFTPDLPRALAGAEAVFVVIGPCGPGQAALAELACALGRCLPQPAAVVLKSTAPVGSCEALREQLDEGLRARGLPGRVPVLSNPEFLREGSALRDFLEPGRIVVGAATIQQAEVLRRVYAPLLARGTRWLCLDLRSAELSKHAASAMLAARISFINEMAAIAEALGADVEQVREVLASDPRLGAGELQAGIGWGGCGLSHDLAGLRRAATSQGLRPRLLGAVEAVNAVQRAWLFERLCDFYGGPHGLRGRRLALWGLAYKPGTDDTRESPGLWLARRLLEAGAHLAAYDPVALRGAARELGHPVRLHCARSATDALQGADALLLATEWAEFRRVDPHEAARALRDRVVFDGRNALDAARWRAAGLRLLQVGRAWPHGGLPSRALRPAAPADSAVGSGPEPAGRRASNA